MQDLVNRLVSTSQPFLRMHGAPEYRDWAAGLRQLAAAPELAVVRPVLEGLAENRLSTLEPLNAFLRTGKDAIRLDELWDASPRIESAVAENSHAALVAATVVLQCWSARLGESLYGQASGMPDPSWGRHPYVGALAALRSGAIDESLRLIETSLDVLNAAKYQHDPRLQQAIGRYRALAREVETRWQRALDDLAADLQDGCRAQAPNFRPEMGALLWTLGLVPESQTFRPDAPRVELPPRRLCRQVVQVSLLGVAHDPLTQYIWLEMKDREPFNIRDHPVFFGALNVRYHYHQLDDVLPEPPSRVFARTVIGWFRGDLSRSLAADYIEAFELVQASFPQTDWSIYIRMSLLASMVAERFHWLTDDSQSQRLEVLGDLVNMATSVNRNRFMHPEWPELFTRITGPSFALLEQLPAESDAVERRVDSLEGFRAGAMKYWLTVATPRPSPAEANAAAGVLDEERELVADLKGAYFLMLTRILPMHYRRSAREIDPGDPRSMRYPAVEEGPPHYTRLLGELDALQERLQTLAPAYAASRGAAAASLHSLADALGRHRGRSPAQPASSSPT